MNSNVASSAHPCDDDVLSASLVTTPLVRHLIAVKWCDTILMWRIVGNLCAFRFSFIIYRLVRMLSISKVIASTRTTFDFFFDSITHIFFPELHFSQIQNSSSGSHQFSLTWKYEFCPLRRKQSSINCSNDLNSRWWKVSERASWVSREMSVFAESRENNNWKNCTKRSRHADSDREYIYYFFWAMSVIIWYSRIGR